jgi:chromosome segregation ATPase
MTDRYTELVKQAYEAQQAREGSSYQALTAELAQIDADLEALAAKREGAVAALESMDDAVEAAKEALDAYFAGRDEDDDVLFDNAELDVAIHDTDDLVYRNELNTIRTAGMVYGSEPTLIRVTDDEFSTPRANGALTD